jgi:hypothetical protein
MEKVITEVPKAKKILFKLFQRAPKEQYFEIMLHESSKNPNQRIASSGRRIKTQPTMDIMAG